MSDCFKCKSCDKSTKIKSKIKYLKPQYHQALTKIKISRYYFTNSSFLHLEDLLKEYVNDYIKKFEILIFLCNFEIKFKDITFDFKISRMYNLHPYYYLRKNLISKIDYFTIEGHKFSHITKMTLTFIANSNNMTYAY